MQLNPERLFNEGELAETARHHEGEGGKGKTGERVWDTEGPGRDGV